MVSSAEQQELLDAIRQKRYRGVRFAELTKLVEAYGCVLARVKGSHYIYTHSRLNRPIVIPYHGSDVKPGVCRQVVKTLLEEIIPEEEGDSYGY